MIGEDSETGILFDMSAIEDELNSNIDNLYNELLNKTKRISQNVVELKYRKKTAKKQLKGELNQIINLAKELKQTI